MSGLFDVPGFVIAMVSIDLMHVSDLGILQVLLGNVLFELFKQVGGLITEPLEGLSRLNLMIAAAAKRVSPEKTMIKFTKIVKN